MFHHLKLMLKKRINHKTDYEHWREGEKLIKVPWVIKYYGSITDINQYKYGLKVKNRAVISVAITAFLAGFLYGFIW